jgi:pantothenate synthetase
LQDVETINGPILTAIAVRIGTTRLIDNFIIM